MLPLWNEMNIRGFIASPRDTYGGTSITSLPHFQSYSRDTYIRAADLDSSRESNGRV